EGTEGPARTAACLKLGGTDLHRLFGIDRVRLDVEDGEDEGATPRSGGVTGLHLSSGHRAAGARVSREPWRGHHRGLGDDSGQSRVVRGLHQAGVDQAGARGTAGAAYQHRGVAIVVEGHLDAVRTLANVV